MEQEEIKTRIIELVNEWACDEENHQVYFKELKESIIFCNDDYDYKKNPETDFKQLENENQLKDLVEKGINYMLSEFGWVYVYICKDNRIVSIEWPDNDSDGEMENWKDHLKFCDEMIPDIYYEGWD